MSSPAPDTQDLRSPASRKGGLARNTVNLVFGQVSTTALTIILSAVIARTLGPTDYGVLFLVTSVATFAYVFVDWGHGQYVIREVARRPDRAGELMGTVMAVRAATAIALIAPAVLVARLLGYDVRTQIGIASMMVAWLPLYLGLSYGWAYRGIERMEFDALIGIVLKLLSLAAGVAILAAGGRLFGVIVAHGVAGVVTFTVGTFIYRRLKLSPLRVSRETARELIVGGTPMVTMTIAVAAQPYIDANLLSRLAGAGTLGWYGAAAAFTNTLVAPAFVLASAAYPRLSVAAGDPNEFSRILRDALRPLLFVAVLGGVGTYLFADVAVGIVYSTKQFGPSASILRAFTPGMVLVFIDMMLATAILAGGSALSLAGAKVLTVAVVTTLELFLVPFFQARYGNGGIGVVSSFAVGEMVMIAAAIRLLPRGALSRSLATDVVRAFAAGAGTLVLGSSLKGVSPIVGIPGCVVLFTILAAAVGLITRADVAAIAGVVARRRPARADVAPALTS
jgi:O-antigen/teichoic acid export membrane protein